MRPVLIPGPCDGVAPDDEYVRRYWVAVVGPTAVADLLRLIAAARRREALPRPTHLSTLLAEGLAWSVCGRIIVPTTIPRIGARSLRRLPLPLRRELRPSD